MIHTEHDGPVTTLRLEHGKASAFDLELCLAIAAAVSAAEERDETRAVILTGTGSIFSAGVDLVRVAKEGADYLKQFLPALDAAFRTVFACTKPVVGAINGHAVAGGAILACACDHRVMADGKGRIGVPELLVGVPFPTMATEILRFALPRHTVQRAAYLGETVPPADAVVRGFVDEVTPAGELATRAREVASSFASIPAAAWSQTKAQLRGPALAAAPPENALEAEITATWCAPETLAGIEAYLEKTLRG